MVFLAWRNKFVVNIKTLGAGSWFTTSTPTHICGSTFMARENEKKKFQRKHRRTKPVILDDGDRAKQFSSSIGLTILAIRQYWLQEMNVIDRDAPALSVDNFLNESNFEECYLKTIGLYQGIRNAPIDSAKAQLYDIPKHLTTMDYFKLREEFRAVKNGRNPKEECTKLLDGVQRILDKTKQYLHESKNQPKDRYFWRQYPDHSKPDGILPNMELFRLWRDAFLGGPLPPDAIPDDGNPDTSNARP
jgi:hypothetical protein